MSKESDSQVGDWLDKWAGWKREQYGLDAIGYPSCSPEQVMIRSSVPDYVPIDNDRIEQLVDSAIKTCPRDEVFAINLLYRVIYIEGVKTQKDMAGHMNISLDAFKRKVAKAKTSVRTILMVHGIIENPYLQAA